MSGDVRQAARSQVSVNALDAVVLLASVALVDGAGEVSTEGGQSTGDERDFT